MNLTTFVNAIGRLADDGNTVLGPIDQNLLEEYKDKFVYRTGLDATTQELSGIKVSKAKSEHLLEVGSNADKRKKIYDRIFKI